MMWRPKFEDLLKKRSEAWSASPVSANHTEALKLSSQLLMEEAEELKQAAENIEQSIPEKPTWKATSTVINNPWPAPTLLAAPDPRGRGPVARPKSVKKVETSFGRKAVEKQRPKSAPRSRPLDPKLAETLDRLAAPKQPKQSVKAGESSSGSQPKEMKKSKQVGSLPSVVFKKQVRAAREVRKRPSVVIPMGGLTLSKGDGMKESSDLPGWFAPGSGEVDTQTVFDAVHALARELAGHVHLKEYDKVTECQAVKEWVCATKSRTVVACDQSEPCNSYQDEGVVFLESDRPPFPSFDRWKYGSTVFDGKQPHGSHTRSDMRCYSRCRRLYARSSELITFEELTAVRMARDACHFFLHGGPCNRLWVEDSRYLFEKPCFHTHWVRKVLYCPLSKLVGGVLVDIQGARGCFRVTGFSANIPPCVSLDELSDAGVVPCLKALICVKKETPLSSGDVDINDSYTQSTKEQTDNGARGNIDNDDDDSGNDGGGGDDDGRGDNDGKVESEDCNESVVLSDRQSDSSSLSSEGFVIRRHSMPIRLKTEERKKNLTKRDLSIAAETKSHDWNPSSFQGPTPTARHVSHLFSHNQSDSILRVDMNSDMNSDMSSKAEAITQSSFDVTKVETNKMETDLEKQWFKGCGEWTLDPSSGCDRYGLVSPIAIIKCAERHTQNLRRFRKERRARSRDLFKQGVMNSLKRSEEAKILEARERALQEAATLAEEEATYEAESVERINQQMVREPWCKALWEALWVGQLDSIKQCFQGMIDNGIITDAAATLYHCEVIFPPKKHGGPPLRVVRLEPCGAPSSLKTCTVPQDSQYSLYFKGKPRRLLVHSCMTALDAYLCMHKLDQSTNNLHVAPPKPDEDTLTWLQENCASDVDFQYVLQDAFALVIPPDDHTLSSVSLCELPCDQVLSESLLIPTIGKHVVMEVPQVTGEKIDIPSSDESTLHSHDDSTVESRRHSLQPTVELSGVGPLKRGGSKTGTSLWWKLREEALRDKAGATDIHYTKREPVRYKRMNSGRLM